MKGPPVSIARAIVEDLFLHKTSLMKMFLSLTSFVSLYLYCGLKLSHDDFDKLFFLKRFYL
jgi:hypothetical protein